MAFLTQERWLSTRRHALAKALAPDLMLLYELGAHERPVGQARVVSVKPR
ncbi:MAG: hypothetical protein ABI488_09230 [Polyangiaceae bacterium]